MISERTRIANPIYDGAFKYLLDDNRVARFFLSVLMDEEVVELDLRPTEHCTDIERKSLTVFRIDFSARIRSKDGTEKLVIVEIQKAKYATDIMRFRRYLGQQYASENNVCEDPPKDPKALPIFSIYLLGHKLRYLREPVIRVSREYRDIAGKVISGPREEFIESLTHDSIVVQIPMLKPSRQTDLELLLGLFDQSQAEPCNLQVLSICDDDYPERFQPVIRRLMKACSEPAIRAKMQVEEDYLNELERLERNIAYREDMIARKDDIIVEKENVIAEKKSIIAEKENVIAEKEHVIAEKESALAESQAKLQQIIEKLVTSGMPREEAIRLVTG